MKKLSHLKLNCIFHYFKSWNKSLFSYFLKKTVLTFRKLWVIKSIYYKWIGVLPLLKFSVLLIFHDCNPNKNHICYSSNYHTHFYRPVNWASKKLLASCQSDTTRKQNRNQNRYPLFAIFLNSIRYIQYYTFKKIFPNINIFIY